MLGNRWNSLRDRENKISARRDANYRRAQQVRSGRQDHQAFEEEFSELAKLRKFNSKELRKKQIETRLKEISSAGSPLSSALKQEKKDLNSENQEGVAARKKWAANATEIREKIQELQKSQLKNARVHDSRPSSPPTQNDFNGEGTYLIKLTFT